MNINILVNSQPQSDDKDQLQLLTETETSPQMTFATPKSLSNATDQVNHNHSSPFKEKILSNHFTTNGITTNGNSNTLIEDGLPLQFSDGIQTNGNSHTHIPTKDQSMPIAVVGIGCRFPGDATSPDKLWELISKGRSAHGEFPKDRFNIDAFYHPSGERQGTVSDQTTRLHARVNAETQINLRGGYFLKDDIATFDAPFFSITPNEARSMDPQQRLLLEVAYESLENGGDILNNLYQVEWTGLTFSFTCSWTAHGRYRW